MPVFSGQVWRRWSYSKSHCATFFVNDNLTSVCVGGRGDTVSGIVFKHFFNAKSLIYNKYDLDHVH